MQSLKVTDTRMHIKAEYEYRFMLFRHWSLYDAMYHSQYVATQLGVWTNKVGVTYNFVLIFLSDVIEYR